MTHLTVNIWRYSRINVRGRYFPINRNRLRFESMTLIRYENRDSFLTEREKFSILGVLILAGALTAIDVVEDWLDGASLTHIVPEVMIIFGVSGIALYLFRSSLQNRNVLIEESRKEMALAKNEAKVWRSKAQSLSKGITDAISGQLEEWSLTPAERDISFLLLKGLTIQEIAQIRETSERTIRQQASEVYKKSGLTGRAQLSAFFMEDLFDR